MKKIRLKITIILNKSDDLMLRIVPVRVINYQKRQDDCMKQTLFENCILIDELKKKQPVVIFTWS
jgi:hypothetical protein